MQHRSYIFATPSTRMLHSPPLTSAVVGDFFFFSPSDLCWNERRGRRRRGSPLRSKAQLSCSPFLFNTTQGSSLDLTSRPPQRHRNISTSARDVNQHHTGRHTNDNETENTCHRPPAPLSPAGPAGPRPGLGIVADCPCSSVPPPGRCPCCLWCSVSSERGWFGYGQHPQHHGAP